MEFDLASYAGLAVAVTTLIQFGKKFLPDKWIAGKSQILSVLLAVVLGVVLKVSGEGYDAIGWADHVFALLIAGAGAQVTYERVLKPAKDALPAKKPKEA